MPASGKSRKPVSTPRRAPTFSACRARSRIFSSRSIASVVAFSPRESHSSLTASPASLWLARVPTQEASSSGWAKTARIRSISNTLPHCRVCVQGSNSRRHSAHQKESGLSPGLVRPSRCSYLSAMLDSSLLDLVPLRKKDQRRANRRAANGGGSSSPKSRISPTDSSSRDHRAGRPERSGTSGRAARRSPAGLRPAVRKQDVQPAAIPVRFPEKADHGPRAARARSMTRRDTLPSSQQHGRSSPSG